MGFPTYEMCSFTNWDTKETTYNVAIIGADDFYEKIALGPGVLGSDGYATKAEARVEAAAKLRALADRIEKGVE